MTICFNKFIASFREFNPDRLKYHAQRSDFAAQDNVVDGIVESRKDSGKVGVQSQ